MTIFPQKLVNVEVASKPDINSIPEIEASIESVEKELVGKGRVLVRYSGTQPMCRVMVEAPTDSEAERHAKTIAKVISKQIGSHNE